MADSIPTVLSQLALLGVSVQWRDGKAVFRAAAAPPADIVALIDARKTEVSAFLCPEAVQRRLDAEAEVLRATGPPDINDDRWETAMKGLRSFIERGHGDEALRLGWPHDELFAVPPLWSRVDLCGAGLLIGDGEVISVTSSRIGIRTSNGSEQGFYRKPTVDYALVVRERLRQLGLDAGKEEFRLRAVEHAVNVCRANTGLDLESAKKLVLTAVNSTKETTTP
jgi:hypothetical protein